VSDRVAVQHRNVLRTSGRSCGCRPSVGNPESVRPVRVKRQSSRFRMASVLPHLDLAAVVLEGDLVHEFADQVYAAPVVGIQVVGVLRI